MDLRVVTVIPQKMGGPRVPKEFSAPFIHFIFFIFFVLLTFTIPCPTYAANTVVSVPTAVPAGGDPLYKLTTVGGDTLTVTPTGSIIDTVGEDGGAKVQPTIQMDGNTSVSFSGPITRTVAGPVMKATGNNPGTLTFVNSSAVSAQKNTEVAIDWNLGKGGNATLTNNAGATIRGQILLPTTAGVVTTFNVLGGGKIDGNISGGGGAISNLSFLGTYSTPGTGSTINGVTNISVSNAGTVFESKATDDITNFTTFTVDPQTQAIARSNWSGANTVTVGGKLTLDTGSKITVPNLNLNSKNSVVEVIAKGATIQAPMTGVAGSTFNVNADFTSSDTLTGVDNINVASGVKFTVAKSITNYTNFVNNGNVVINPGTAVLGGGMTGGVNSSVEFQVSGVPTYKTAGDFTNINTILVSDGTLQINNNFTGFSSFTIGKGPTGNAIMAAGSSLNGTQVNLVNKLEVQAGTITANIVGQPTAELVFDNNFTTNGNIMNVPNITAKAQFNINNSITGVSKFGNLGQTFVNSGGVLGDNTTSLAITSGGGSFTVNGGQVIAKGDIASPTVFALNSGSFTGNVNNAGTVNLNGGTLTGNINNNPNVNVGGPFTTGGTIAANNLIVTNTGAFTINNAVTATNFTVNAGGSTTLNQNLISNNVNNAGSFNLNADVTGAFNNTGTLALNTTTRNISNGFTQSAAGTLQVALEDMNPGDFGQVHTPGAANLQGAIRVVLPDNGVKISSGDTFDVVVADGGLVANNVTVQSPPSALLSFAHDTDPSVPGTVFRLIAERATLESLASGVTAGVAGALDAIRADTPTSDQLALLRAFDGLATADQVEQALLSLAPDPNGATILSTLYTTVDIPLERIAKKLQSMRAGMDLFKTGYAAGDIAGGHGTYGPLIFANNITQKAVNGVPGFNAITWGGGLQGDIPVFRYAKLGIAGTVSSTTVKDTSTSSPVKTTISSAQASIYGSIDYCLFFADGLIGYAWNRYKTDRTIALINGTTMAKYSGTQIAGRLDAGLSLPMGRAELAPITTLRFNEVMLGGFTETGAPAVALTVAPRTVESIRTGIGLRFADVSQIEDFLPELHALFLYETKSPQLAVTSTFTAGGPSFVTNVPSPSRNSVNLGISAAGIIYRNMIVRLSYDLELKRNYTSHTASAKLLWMFDLFPVCCK